MMFLCHCVFVVDIIILQLCSDATYIVFLMNEALHLLTQATHNEVVGMDGGRVIE